MQRIGRRTAFAASICVFVLTFILVCTAGKYPLSVSDIANIIIGRITGTEADVFFKIRLPRVVFSAVSGAVLALSGYAYQALFSNPLASPDVLGASGGAGVGAALAMLIGLSSAGVQGASLVFSLAAVAVTALLSALMGKMQTSSLVLSGIVVKALCDAVLMMLKYTADSEGKLAAIEYRLMGTYQNVRSIHIWQILPIVIAAIILLYLLRWRIRILSLGDSEAETLGVPSGMLRVLCIAAATLPVAATVSVSGIVSWVGLIVPHAVSFFMQGDLKDNFGVCAVSGAVFMMWTDTAARTLSDAEIPISILTSFVGAVFLAAVLIYRKRQGTDNE